MDSSETLYTINNSDSFDYPPTFITVSGDNPIANASGMDRRVENLRLSGITVEYHRVKHTGHGFGIGFGNDTEGWMDYAAQFWKDNLSN